MYAGTPLMNPVLIKVMFASQLLRRVNERAEKNRIFPEWEMVEVKKQSASVQPREAGALHDFDYLQQPQLAN